MKWRLNEAASPIGSIHGDRRLCNEGRPLVVFVEGEEELIRRVAILCTVLVNALDRLTQNMPIERVCIVDVGGVVLTLTDIEGKAAERFYLIEEPVGKFAQFLIGLDVPDRIKCRALFLPNGWMLIRAVDLELQQLTFPLIKPSSKVADFIDGKHKPGKAEDWAIVVMGIIAANVRADVAKLIQISNVGQSTPQKTRKPALARGPRNEGNTSLRLVGVDSRSGFDCQLH